MSVNPEVHDQWLAWMRQHFLSSVMLSGHFTEKRMLKLLHEEPEQWITYSVQLLSPSMETLQEYIDTKEGLLEKPLREKYGKDFVEFRTFLEMLDE